jgi:hypothetical protein
MPGRVTSQKTKSRERARDLQLGDSGQQLIDDGLAVLPHRWQCLPVVAAFACMRSPAQIKTTHKSRWIPSHLPRARFQIAATAGGSGVLLKPS